MRVTSWSCYRIGNGSDDNNDDNVANSLHSIYYVLGTKHLNSFNPHNNPIRRYNYVLLLSLFYM